ncbi:MAG: thioredoxin family protein [Flavobacteriaceae bacterium]|nr:thioredoxin family protein [Flavobacteriaceae bacterium]
MMIKLKIIGFIAMLVWSLPLVAQKKGYDLNWQSDIEQAKMMAKENDKLILIYFTSSDASITASKSLNEDFFYTEKFKNLADKNLVLVRVNIPRRENLISELQKNTNQELRIKYEQRVIPTVVVCDSNGNKLGMIESYNYLHDTSKHYALINNALKNQR